MYVNEWIVVCIILYNLFVTFVDTAWEEEEDEQINTEGLGEVAATDDGINLRQRVQNNLMMYQ